MKSDLPICVADIMHDMPDADRMASLMRTPPTAPVNYKDAAGDYDQCADDCPEIHKSTEPYPPERRPDQQSVAERLQYGSRCFPRRKDEQAMCDNFEHSHRAEERPPLGVRRMPGERPVGLRLPSVPGPRHITRSACLTLFAARRKSAPLHQLCALCDRHLHARNSCGGFARPGLVVSPESSGQYPLLSLPRTRYDPRTIGKAGVH